MEILIRATVVFFLLLVITRGLGKRELSEMSVFELILLVVIGDLVQQGITLEDNSVTGAALAVGTFAFWVLVLSWLSFWSDRARSVIDGVPVVVVRDGKPLQDVLRLERVPLDEGAASTCPSCASSLLRPSAELSFVPLTAVCSGERIQGDAVSAAGSPPRVAWSRDLPVPTSQYADSHEEQWEIDRSDR